MSIEEKKHINDVSPLRFLSAVNKEALKEFTELRSVIMGEGVLTSKEKLLIALACTIALKCESCIENHTKEALKSGIKMEEILEAASVAGLVCGGSGFSFASMVLEVDE
ncbi:MAG: carboxymuconolactone decarboxylase family protein [Methanosarcinales archaeon]|nr:carboxymuconolactone decarboxylase family protein [Methanosarcinales archaeon]